MLSTLRDNCGTVDEAGASSGRARIDVAAVVLHGIRFIDAFDLHRGIRVWARRADARCEGAGLQRDHGRCRPRAACHSAAAAEPAHRCARTPAAPRVTRQFSAPNSRCRPAAPRPASAAAAGYEADAEQQARSEDSQGCSHGAPLSSSVSFGDGADPRSVLPNSLSRICKGAAPRSRESGGHGHGAVRLGNRSVQKLNKRPTVDLRQSARTDPETQRFTVHHTLRYRTSPHSAAWLCARLPRRRSAACSAPSSECAVVGASGRSVRRSAGPALESGRRQVRHSARRDPAHQLLRQALLPGEPGAGVHASRRRSEHVQPDRDARATTASSSTATTCRTSSSPADIGRSHQRSAVPTARAGVSVRARATRPTWSGRSGRSVTARSAAR